MLCTNQQPQAASIALSLLFVAWARHPQLRLHPVHLQNDFIAELRSGGARGATCCAAAT
jgi:hypothetical protein